MENFISQFMFQCLEANGPLRSHLNYHCHFHYYHFWYCCVSILRQIVWCDHITLPTTRCKRHYFYWITLTNFRTYILFACYFRVHALSRANISHHRHFRRWCTFSKRVHFLAWRTRNLFLFWLIFHKFTHFLVPCLNTVITYQNWQISVMSLSQLACTTCDRYSQLVKMR